MNNLKASPLPSTELPTWLRSFMQYVTLERLRQGLSIGELAESAGVPEPEIIEIESNEHHLPSVEVFIKVADALKLDSGVSLEFVTPYENLFHWAFQRTTCDYMHSLDQQAAKPSAAVH